MNYLYGWNSVAEFIVDEFASFNTPVAGVIVDDQYLNPNIYPKEITIIPRSEIIFTSNDTVINCIGYKNLTHRINIGDQLYGLGILKSFISKMAKIHHSSRIGIGSVLLGDVVIEKGCDIGRHSLLWGGSRVCHDSSLGSGVFLAAGSIIGGGCMVGDTCSLGFNSSMREKSFMPGNTKVGANQFWRPVHD